MKKKSGSVVMKTGLLFLVLSPFHVFAWGNASIEKFIQVYLENISQNETRHDKEAELSDFGAENFISYLPKMYQDLPADKQQEDVYSPFLTRKILLDLIKDQFPRVIYPVKMNLDIWEDTHVLGDREKGQTSLINKLFPGYTISGELIKVLFLAQPSTKRSDIEQQQDRIYRVMSAPVHQKLLIDSLKGLAQHEAVVISLFDDEGEINSPDIQEWVEVFENNTYYSKIIDWTSYLFFTSLSYADRGLYLINRIALLTSVITAESYCSFGFPVKVASVGLFFLADSFIYQLNNFVEELSRPFKLARYKLMRKSIDSLNSYLENAIQLSEIDGIPHDLALTFSADEKARIKEFIGNIKWLKNTDPMRENHEYESYVSGYIWQALALKPVIQRMLYQTGKIDAYFSIAMRMQAERVEGYADKAKLTFVTFADNKPSIKAENLWNPMIDSETVAVNSITMSSQHQCQNTPVFQEYLRTDICDLKDNTDTNILVLSGGNASGKSTLMRAISVNSIFLAQTLGIASAESFRTGLFDAAFSYMDKNDLVGIASSFQMELEHVSRIEAEIEALDAGEAILTSFDELFSSTNPVKGTFYTLKTLEKMSHNPELLAIVSSHYDLESNARIDNNKLMFKHLHMYRENDVLIKTYQLQDGQDQQKNGLSHLLEAFKSFPDIHSGIKSLIDGEEIEDEEIGR